MVDTLYCLFAMDERYTKTDRKGRTIAFKPSTCLVCRSDKDKEVTVETPSEMHEHEKEEGHACWDTDWKGHWEIVEDNE